MTALTRVFLPISPHQQRHLAFISEFNVQMLYLPGLKKVVADFLSPPSPPPLKFAETVTAEIFSMSVPGYASLKLQTAVTENGEILE